MSSPDPALVKLIAQAVEQALQATGGAPSASPATIQPPVGLCTAGHAAAAEPEADPTSEPAPVALTGIVTADQLTKAIADSPTGVATLDARARLTPLAADYAHDHPEQLARLNSTANGGASMTPGASLPSSSPWLLWIDGHCPTVAQLMQQHRGLLRPSAAPKSEAGLVAVVEDLAAGVRRGTCPGGLIFTRQAPLASLLVNRSETLRGAVCVSTDHVRQAVDDLAANVFILEYPRLQADKLTAFADTILRSQPNASPMLARTLARVRRA